VGFRTSAGIEGAGPLYKAFTTGGGHIIGMHKVGLGVHGLILGVDMGASKLISERKVKLKNDSQIARFTKEGLEFENGSTIDADVVIFATG